MSPVTTTTTTATIAAAAPLDSIPATRPGPFDLLPELAGVAAAWRPESCYSPPPSPTTPAHGRIAASSAASSPLSSPVYTSASAILRARALSTGRPAKTSYSASSCSSAASDDSPRVVYGAGTLARLPAELNRLRLTSPLIVSSPSRMTLARHVQALIADYDSHILDSAVVSVPARVVDDAVDRISGRDVVISIGGASAVGLAKAIGCRKAIPHICIPTTYSGSEMMPLLLDASPARHSSAAVAAAAVAAGKTHRPRHKKPVDAARHRRRASTSSLSRSKSKPAASTNNMIRDPRVLPTVVIYDMNLTTSPSDRFSVSPSALAQMPDKDAAATRSAKGDETVQWSYIHLPGV
ncbi:hypothetical protein CDD82_1135 [Ophiocordyceps australis]|uniref:Alcohol dehydrogenase iron-type/glycerol dehydrogenase GldA domain-containing protein n=1 Tax=Ophiocordyceps australis TaxID=1399860 RepID=A0A2C5YE43_9HYPO|nr:hypothetical protein CDD82_1135 [Ophiocordyceps australis]